MTFEEWLKANAVDVDERTETLLHLAYLAGQREELNQSRERTNRIFGESVKLAATK